MKQQERSVDARIKQFMQHKMAEHPELDGEVESRVEDIQREYLWDSFVGLFAKHQRAN